MDKLEYWKLCTEFTVVQAALIVCGIAPEDMQWEVERKSESRCPAGYVAIKTAFVHALKSGQIAPSKTVFITDDEGEPTMSIDIHSTTIAAAEIHRFLKKKRVICDFFDNEEEGLGGSDLSISPMPIKLNAALKAWSAVSSDPARLRGKSPKQAMKQWLIENAGDLGLHHRDGRPNRTGIEEICKVANWKPAGGATPTPTAAVPTKMAEQSLARPMIRLPLPKQGVEAELDDEIPF